MLLEELQKTLRHVSLAKDEILFRAGDESSDGYVLSMGEIQLSRRLGQSNAMQIHMVREGEVFGVWKAFY